MQDNLLIFCSSQTFTFKLLMFGSASADGKKEERGYRKHKKVKKLCND